MHCLVSNVLEAMQVQLLYRCAYSANWIEPVGLPFLARTAVQKARAMANFNYMWQGGAMPFPSSAVSTQVQFGPQAGSQLPVPQAQLNFTFFCSALCPASMTINHGAMNSGNDFYLKVLCPENKKKYKTVTLRGLSPEGIDTPTKLKEAISGQCDGLDAENWKLVTTPIQQSLGLLVAWILMMFGAVLVGERN